MGQGIPQARAARHHGLAIFPVIRDERTHAQNREGKGGEGLLACLELVRDRASQAPLVPPNTDSPLPLQIRRRGWDEGIHFMARGSLILVAPPLIVQPDQIEEGVAKLDRVLSWVDAAELPAG